MLLILKSTNLRTAAIALINMMAQVVASWAKEGVLIGINNTGPLKIKLAFKLQSMIFFIIKYIVVVKFNHMI